MKKICIVNFNVYCLFNPKSKAPMGGAELDMYVLAKGLQNEFNVSVITGDWGQKKIEKYGKVTVIRSVKLGGKNYLKALLIFLVELKKVNANVYISTSAGPEIGLIALFCKLFKKKFIYRTASEIDCNRGFVESHKIFGKIFEYGLLHSSKIVTSVNNHKDILTKTYKNISGENILFIPLAINIKRGEDKYLNLDKKNNILWIARGIKLKRPEIFLELAKKLADEEFTMIMPKQKGEEALFNNIKKKAENIKNLKFIGGVPFNQTQRYFDKAKVFVNTSDYEGFTYTLIQSGLAKTPVAYLNVNPDDVITNNNIGCYADGNKKKLYQDVKLLCRNQGIWRKKSEATYEYVRKNHDINIIGEQWRDVINNL